MDSTALLAASSVDSALLAWYDSGPPRLSIGVSADGPPRTRREGGGGGGGGGADGGTCVGRVCRDANNGMVLRSYKTTATPRNGLSAVGRDHLVAAQNTKGTLHFWSMRKVIRPSLWSTRPGLLLLKRHYSRLTRRGLVAGGRAGAAVAPQLHAGGRGACMLQYKRASVRRGWSFGHGAYSSLPLAKPYHTHPATTPSWAKDAGSTDPNRTFASRETLRVLFSRDIHHPEGCIPAPHSCGAVGAGQVHMWETASGRLLKSWPAHYKAVTALAFTDDDSLLLSASEDTVVHTWSLLVVLDAFAEDFAPPVPMYSWYDLLPSSR
jgi:hypothetical protein